MNKDIKEQLKKKIEEGEVKIRSKKYFQALKIVSLGLLGGLFLISIYLFNLSLYLPRRGMHRPTIGTFWAGIPWILVGLGILLVWLIIYLYRRYEGGYKKSLLATSLVIAGVILGLASLIAFTNFNQRLERGPRLKRMYENLDRGFGPGRNIPGQNPRRMPQGPDSLKYFN